MYLAQVLLQMVTNHMKMAFPSVVTVHSLSSVQLIATSRTAACQSSPSFTISWSLLKFMSIEFVMPSNHLVLCHPLLLLPSIFPNIRVFSNELAFASKYRSFSFSISPFNEYSGLISFRIEWFDILVVQGLSRVFSNTTVQKHQFFSTQSSLCECPGVSRRGVGRQTGALNTTVLGAGISPFEGISPSEGGHHYCRKTENNNHRKLNNLITWTTALSNSMKL